MYKLLLSFMIIWDVDRSFIRDKTTFTKYCLPQWISKLPGNSLSKAVPGEFHGSGRHSKCNCLPDRANFHKSQAWQIVMFLTLCMRGFYFVFFVGFYIITNSHCESMLPYLHFARPPFWWKVSTPLIDSVHQNEPDKIVKRLRCEGVIGILHCCLSLYHENHIKSCMAKIDTNINYS